MEFFFSVIFFFLDLDIDIDIGPVSWIIFFSFVG